MRHPLGSFAGRLALLALLGLAARLAYVLLVQRGTEVTGDGFQYSLYAQLVAGGFGYVQPFPRILEGASIPSADKPPLYPLLLAIPAKLGFGSADAFRVASCLMGSALVVATGLLGRRVAGERAGLVAAAIAALYPSLVVLDGAVRAESLYAPLIAFSLLLAYRLRDRPSPWRAAAWGGLIGLAALTRSEALALLGLLVPLLWPLRASPRRAVALAVTAVLACLVPVGPWVVRNWSTFGRPALSTNEGGLLAGANNDATYFSPLVGSWVFPTAPRGAGTNEAVISERLRARAFAYMGDHTRRLPRVVAVRLGRVWELYRPWAVDVYEAGIADRHVRTHQAGVAVYYVLLVLAAVGVLRLRRRGEPVWILLAPFVLVTLVAAISYGTTRFRVAAEIPLVVLAAVVVAEAGRRRAAPGAEPRREATSAPTTVGP